MAIYNFVFDIQSVPYQIGLILRFKDKNTHIILEKPSIFCKKYFKMGVRPRERFLDPPPAPPSYQFCT